MGNWGTAISKFLSKGATPSVVGLRSGKSRTCIFPRIGKRGKGALEVRRGDRLEASEARFGELVPDNSSTEQDREGWGLRQRITGKKRKITQVSLLEDPHQKEMLHLGKTKKKQGGQKEPWKEMTSFTIKGDQQKKTGKRATSGFKENVVGLVGIRRWWERGSLTSGVRGNWNPFRKGEKGGSNRDPKERGLISGPW